MDFFLLSLLRLAESDAKLNALKAMVNNAVAFFYLSGSSSNVRAPQMLDSLPTQSREIILANMRQSALTLGFLKSLYYWADLDVEGEGFVVTCNDEEALKLAEDSAKTAGQVVDMLGVDMSLGWVSSLKYFVLLRVTILSRMGDLW
jgi:hypothetical protein